MKTGEDLINDRNGSSTAKCERKNDAISPMRNVLSLRQKFLVVGEAYSDLPLAVVKRGTLVAFGFSEGGTQEMSASTAFHSGNSFGVAKLMLPCRSFIELRVHA